MTIDFQPRLINLMLSQALTRADREALLTEAFYADASSKHVVDAIELDGAPRIFCINAIRVIMDRNCQLLKPLLTTLKYRYGGEQQAEADQLLGMVDAVCAEIKERHEDDGSEASTSTSESSASNSTSPSPDVNDSPPSREYTESELKDKMVAHLGRADLEVIVLDLNSRLPKYRLSFDRFSHNRVDVIIVQLLVWLRQRNQLPELVKYLSESDEYSYVLADD